MNLRDQISRGEAVLWNGKKSVKVSVLEAIFNPMLPFALIWLAFDAGFYLVTVNWAMSFLKRKAGLEDGNLKISGSLGKLIGRKNSSRACADNDYVIIHSYHSLLLIINIFCVVMYDEKRTRYSLVKEYEFLCSHFSFLLYR